MSATEERGRHSSSTGAGARSFFFSLFPSIYLSIYIYLFILFHPFPLSSCFPLSLSFSLALFSPDVAHASIKHTDFKHAPCTIAHAVSTTLTFRYDVIDAPMRMVCGGLILFSSGTLRNIANTTRVRISECTRRPCDGTAETSVDHGGRAAHETKWEAKRPRGHPVLNTSARHIYMLHISIFDIYYQLTHAK
jgi:hypothetical protein